MKIRNSSLESVGMVKYFVKILTKLNCIKDEIKSILNSANACYHSVENVLSTEGYSKL